MFVFFLCSHWSLVDVPLIFFCPADHVPDWQPRVLLGMVEARSVNVKKTTTNNNRRITNKHHIGGRTVRSETTVFLRQDPHALTVIAEAASDDLQQYLGGVRYQRDAPVVAALCPILLFVKYHDDGIFPLLRHLVPPPNTNDDIEHSPAQGGITVEGDLEQLDGDSVRSDSLSVRQRADGVCQLLYRELNS